MHTQEQARLYWPGDKRIELVTAGKAVNQCTRKGSFLPHNSLRGSREVDKHMSKGQGCYLAPAKQLTFKATKYEYERMYLRSIGIRSRLT